MFIYHIFPIIQNAHSFLQT